MGSAFPIDVRNANPVAESVSRKRNDLQWIDAMLTVARRIWPAKTAFHLANAASVSERAAQFWLAGETGMTLDAARGLMRSEHGFEFLVAYVGEDCDALWFQRIKLAHELGVSKRSIKAQERKLEKMRLKRDQLDLDL